jgi:hypothetical protein
MINIHNTPYISNHLAVAYSVFSTSSYSEPCFKELSQLVLDDKFNKTFTYAIYCDDFIVKENIFVPRFHTYYLNSETKDVIIMDEHLIDLPEIYNHHKYYIYNNEELLNKFVEKHINVQHVNSIKDIINVRTND